MAHYYDEIQDSELKITQFTITLFGMEFAFNTAKGVFSQAGIDKGSLLLVESAIIMDSWKVLDFGCGLGYVGIILAKRFSHAHVTMIDVNRRAVFLAQMNIKENRIKNAASYFSNFFGHVQGAFNTIVVNPPQVAGKKACFKIIEDSKGYLADHGLLQLVARHNKGGETLSKKMSDVFGNVREIAKKSGFRVYVSEKK